MTVSVPSVLMRPSALLRASTLESVAESLRCRLALPLMRASARRSSAIDPTVGDGARERVDAAAVRDGQHIQAGIRSDREGGSHPRKAVKRIKYGRSVGALEAAVVLSAIPLQIVEPTAWEALWRLPGKDKERARQKALEIFPAAHGVLARKKDHGKVKFASLRSTEFARRD